jgi:hypothetical protein
MPPRKKPEWEVQAHGRQLDNIDGDLMAQIVVLLGREIEEAEQEGELDESST